MLRFTILTLLLMLFSIPSISADDQPVGIVVHKGDNDKSGSNRDRAPMHIINPNYFNPTNQDMKKILYNHIAVDMRTSFSFQEKLLSIAPEERYIIAHGEWSENLRFKRNEPWVVDDKLIISCGAAI